MANNIELEILNPRGEVDVELRSPTKRPQTLEGKKIALIDNTKSGARGLLNFLRKHLENDLKDVQFVNLTKKFNEQYRIENFMDKLSGVDAAIYASGD